MQRISTSPVLRHAGFAALAATLLLAACGTAEDDATADDPTPSTPAEQPVTTPDNGVPPSTDAPTSNPPPGTDAPTTDPLPITGGQRFETIRMIIEDADGPKLCFVTLESLPPQCGLGVDLDEWSWDAIDVETVQGDVTWVDQVYLAGTYDPISRTFTVDESRIPTNEDRDRILMSGPLPDHDVPCEMPVDGWPERTQEWPGDEIAALDGYAGAWSDPSGRVMVVAFTGDLAAAEAAVRQFYGEGLCVVAATRSAAELTDIQDRLAAMDDLELLSTSIFVDGTGEWVEAEIIAPDAELQALLDAEFGVDVVRLQPQLLTVA